MAFRSLRDMFPGWLDVCLVELPGRGIRVQEELETNMDRLVHSLVRELVPLLTDSSFALYGHSMGALIAYRLAHELRDEHGLDASALLVSGARAPHLARPPDMLHELPDSQLISRLQRMEGTEAASCAPRRTGPPPPAAKKPPPSPNTPTACAPTASTSPPSAKTASPSAPCRALAGQKRDVETVAAQPGVASPDHRLHRACGRRGSGHIDHCSGECGAGHAPDGLDLFGRYRHA